MANRNRRNAPQRRDTGTPARKKQKVNLFPVAAALVLLLLVVVGFFGLMRSAEPKVEEEPQMPMIGNQPEFFSTIRPETLNTAEMDLEDDPGKVSDIFKNSLFVGDSQMAWLKTQQLANDTVGSYLEQSLFLTADSYSWQSVLNEFSDGAPTLNLYGEQVSLRSAVAKTGAETLVLLLGRTDLVMELPDTAAQLAEDALLKLKKACPDTKIIVLTMAPHTEGSSGYPTNKAIAAFNEHLRAFCATDRSIKLADAAAAFPAEGLPAEYCADPEETGRKLNGEGSMKQVMAILEVLNAKNTAAPTPTEAPAAEATPAPAAEPTEAPVPEATPTPQPTEKPSAGTTGQAAGRETLKG